MRPLRRAGQLLTVKRKGGNHDHLGTGTDTGRMGLHRGRVLVVTVARAAAATGAIKILEVLL
jgi:hypothetical protein